MAKYLKPLRGKFSSAEQQETLLRKGEMFLCMFNNDEMGQGPGAIYLGNGPTAFNGYAHNGSTVPNTAQPFLVHPMIYKPIFANSNPSTASWTIDAGTAEINNMGNGTAEVPLPTVIGNTKAALCKHADSIIKLNNDKGSMQEEIDEINEQLAAHTDKINALENNVSSLNTRVTNAENKINAATSDINSLKTRMTNAENKINAATASIRALYPVGSLYVTTTNTNPNSFLGYGSWSLLTGNYVLKTITSGTGGSTASATNTEGYKLKASDLPKHTHNISSYSTTIGGGGHSHNYDYPIPVPLSSGSGDPAEAIQSGHYSSDNPVHGDGSHTHEVTFAAKDTGDGGFANDAHAHKTGMPASIGVYVWKRTS